jgi:hypothetical protein
VLRNLSRGVELIAPRFFVFSRTDIHVCTFSFVAQMEMTG